MTSMKQMAAEPVYVDGSLTLVRQTSYIEMRGGFCVLKLRIEVALVSCLCLAKIS